LHAAVISNPGHVKSRLDHVLMRVRKQGGATWMKKSIFATRAAAKMMEHGESGLAQSRQSLSP
jgi:hypothetical protein